MIHLHDKTFAPHIEEHDVKLAVERVAREICADYPTEDLVFLSVLNGAFIFTADLVRNIPNTCSISFIRVFSYQGVSSSGQVKEVMGITEQLAGKHVIIVEDIIDSGLTVEYVHQRVLLHKPASVRLCTLLFKKEAYKAQLPVDYAGFEIPNDFVVGYGLDYDGLGRNIPGIYKIVN